MKETDKEKVDISGNKQISGNHEASPKTLKIIIAVLAVLLAVAVVAAIFGLKNSGNIKTKAEPEGETDVWNSEEAASEEGTTAMDFKAESLKKGLTESDNSANEKNAAVKESGKEKQKNTEKAESHEKVSAKSEKSAQITENVESWKKLYRDLLLSNGERPFAGFALAKIDSDNIPELIVTEGGSHMDSAEVFTVKKGKLVSSGKLGSYGLIGYTDNKIVGELSSGAGGDVNRVTVIELRNGNFEPYFYGDQSSGYDDPYCFTVDDREISQEEFIAYYNSFVPDVLKVVGFAPDCFGINNFNRMYGCKSVACSEQIDGCYRGITKENIEDALG